MHRLTVLAALFAVPVLADDRTKPNTLTPKEIADGWVLLFDGETTFGWTVNGHAKVQAGAIAAGGETETVLIPTTPFGACRLRFSFSEDGKTWGQSTIERSPMRFEGSSSPSPKNFSVKAPFGGLFTITIPAGKQAWFRNFCLQPAAMQSLFNGKDLSGWRVYDPTKARAADPKAKVVRVASKYSVTREQSLNVKDGPGDLQTEGQWADFVLQLECISHGKHLNSGIFFRCIPDLYQQGYEAQIRNQWEGDDRTRPVDFGTGAIYRRQPARKVVSTDGEWFTMTVAAHGRHIATWVNGYQIVDWTDDRKEIDNARQGFKKGKGAISIQGHDPTTDLSFRNIRIQSLDPK